MKQLLRGGLAETPGWYDTVGRHPPPRTFRTRKTRGEWRSAEDPYASGGPRGVAAGAAYAAAQASVSASAAFGKAASGPGVDAAVSGIKALLESGKKKGGDGNGVGVRMEEDPEFAAFVAQVEGSGVDVGEGVLEGWYDAARVRQRVYEPLATVGEMVAARVGESVEEAVAEAAGQVGEDEIQVLMEEALDEHGPAVLSALFEELGPEKINAHNLDLVFAYYVGDGSVVSESVRKDRFALIMHAAADAVSGPI